MNTYTIYEDLPGTRHTHGGLREYKTFHFYINGELHKTFNENSAPYYNSGKYLEKEMVDYANMFIHFFGGQIVRARHKNIRKFA